MNLTEYISKSQKIVESPSMKKCKVAFLSNFTINGLGETLHVLSSSHNIYLDFFLPSYNQYTQEILNPSSNLYKFSPDTIFLLLDAESFLGDLHIFPYRLNPEERKNRINEKFLELKEMLLFLQKNISSKIIINTFLLPTTSSRGILENKQEYGLVESIRDFNFQLENFAKNDSQFFVFDMNLFALKKGMEFILDNKLNYLAEMKLSPSAIISLAEEYLAYIFPLMSIVKKCIVLDLDNTLWGGIVGEEGLVNLKLGPEKEGKPFYDFQRKLLELSERGIVLAINSKNNYEDAMQVIKNHPHMLLREENFASIKINWNDKASNLLEIAKELNIGLDSLVFIDDDKTNRAFVKESIPEVFVVELPEDSCNYVDCLNNLQIFNTFSITSEDLQKQEMYLAQIKRDELHSHLPNLESFLKELNLQIEILPINDFNLPRISQLTQKTNQFNLTTRRYSEEDLSNFIKTGNYIIKAISVKDRFGDYGITGVIIAKKLNEFTLELDSFLLSCRVLGKNIEFSFLQEIIGELKKIGVQEIKAIFIPTAKNAPSANFLNEAGFILQEESNGEKKYSLKIGEENKKQSYAEVKHAGS